MEYRGKYRGVPTSSTVFVQIHTPTPREQKIEKLYSKKKIDHGDRNGESNVIFKIANDDDKMDNIKFSKFAVNYTGSCRADKLYNGEMHGIGKNMTQGTRGKYFFLLSSQKIYNYN